MYHLCAWCPQHSEEGIVYLELGLGMVMSHRMGRLSLGMYPWLALNSAILLLIS